MPAQFPCARCGLTNNANRHKRDLPLISAVGQYSSSHCGTQSPEAINTMSLTKASNIQQALTQDQKHSDPLLLDLPGGHLVSVRDDGAGDACYSHRLLDVFSSLTQIRARHRQHCATLHRTRKRLNLP